jgi:hypothetical protein
MDMDDMAMQIQSPSLGKILQQSGYSIPEYDGARRRAQGARETLRHAPLSSPVILSPFDRLTALSTVEGEAKNLLVI